MSSGELAATANVVDPTKSSARPCARVRGLPPNSAPTERPWPTERLGAYRTSLAYLTFVGNVARLTNHPDSTRVTTADRLSKRHGTGRCRAARAIELLTAAGLVFRRLSAETILHEFSENAAHSRPNSQGTGTILTATGAFDGERTDCAIRHPRTHSSEGLF